MTARQYHSKTVKCKGCLIAKNNTHHRENLGPRIKYLARLMLPASRQYGRITSILNARNLRLRDTE